MNVIFSKSAHKELLHWQKTDNGIYNKILELLESITANPFKGIGKPEPLKHDFKGYWSRRITKEHRLIYKVEANEITVISCRFHYL